jgi:hypothetical protein
MRARNIKPGFFKNESLAECDPLARILFIGLWGLADKEGRLEDRPKKIKVEVLAYDDCDVDALLSQLAMRKFITRYEADGKKLIQVERFTKHQRPHPKEPSCGFAGPGQDPATNEPCKSPAEPCKDPVIPRQDNDPTRPVALNPESLNPESLKEEYAASAAPLENYEPKKAEGGADPGWLARLWMFHARRAKNKHDEEVAAVFEEWHRHGVPLKAIEAEIVSKDRDRTEQIWDLEKRLRPAKAPPGRHLPETRTVAQVEADRAERLRLQEERRRADEESMKHQICGSIRLAAQAG